MALIDRTLITNELSKDAAWFNIEMKENSNSISIVLQKEDENLDFRVNKKEIDFLTNVYEYIAIDKVLAFDHDKIIVKALKELHNKVEHTDIIFHLMPDLFTIGELKQVYELLLGKKLINSAFRRKIKEKIIITDKAIKTGGHRPSFLCKYNKKT